MQFGSFSDRADQPGHLGRPGHRPVGMDAAEHPGHPPSEGTPDALAPPVDTRIRALGRDTGAHLLPMATAATDNTHDRSAADRAGTARTR
ncbi:MULTISPECIES: hypothetical protein [unclassified Streptomyces]|uniref:hypothetical protein n=1 Tax=unclassified Streptomyces TaxID=2593676 RepID=UPI0009C1F65B|nr:hypothetical protein [Streptomyces sp. Sge12]ARE72570.1 hypothetical protein B6R96_00225 [Streptomyces sp. Sge12]